MRKYLLAVSLITCISGVTLTSRVFAVVQTQSEPPKVTLYGAGSLRGSLSEVADAFTQEYGISVNREFGPSGLLRERLENGEKTDVFASADIGNPLKNRNILRSPPVAVN